MRYSFAIVLLLTWLPSLSAQVIEVHGGTSTLYDSQGGEITVKGGSYDAAFGGGTIGPQLMGSANLSKRFNGSTLTFGTEVIPFSLPTDIFADDHYLTALGGSVRTTMPSATVFVFGGMMSENFDGPFFQGTRGEQPAAILLFDGKVSPTVSIASRMILAKQITMIEGIAWRPINWAQLAASGGVGAGKGYGAISAKLRYSFVDLKTAYIQTSPGFRRADVDTMLTAEPNRLNAIVTLTPSKRLSATVGHSEYLSPIAGSQADARSSVDQVEANTEVRGLGLSASVFHSTYQGGSDKAVVLSSSRAFGPKVHVQGSYEYSRSSRGPATTSLVTNLTEELTPRWTISQIVNTSNGQSTVGFGTSFLSNLAVFSADYETYYIPQHLPNPFEQVLILNADLKLFGRADIEGGTFVAPDGSVKHTIAADGTFVRNGAIASASDRNPLDRFVLIGRVVDLRNQPVEGAALLIDRVAIYTDSDGQFTLHERQARYHVLQVLSKQFLDGMQYRVMNAPGHIQSALPEAAVMVTIVVTRVAPVCTPRDSCKG